MNARFDIDVLLQPLSPDAPCGDNLEYAPEFTAMLAAAAGRPEQQVGDTHVPAVPPAWDDVAARCEALLGQTRDLRVAVRLTQSWLHLHGVPGLAAGLALVRGYLDRHGVQLHPRLDPEDGDDPAIRISAVALLASLAAIVHPLRDATALLPDAALTLRQVLQARGGEMPDDAARALFATVDQAVADTAPSDLETLADSARGARADARAIEASFSDQAAAALTLDFDPLHKVLAEIDGLAADWFARRAMPAAVAVPEAAHDADAHAHADTEAEVGLALDAPPTPSPAPAPSSPAPISSREDALRALDDVCRWFRRHEPGHPLPILLERARRWIAMDFMDLLRDVAPAAVAEAEKLHGASHAQ
jgi:type VI secretion system protein ImpA